MVESGADESGADGRAGGGDHGLASAVDARLEQQRSYLASEGQSSKAAMHLEQKVLSQAIGPAAGQPSAIRTAVRERFRKARSDRATDVTRIMSLRDSLETLRLHQAEEEPGERC